MPEEFRGKSEDRHPLGTEAYPPLRSFALHGQPAAATWKHWDASTSVTPARRKQTKTVVLSEKPRFPILDQILKARSV
jgi:hypothetical protein